MYQVFMDGFRQLCHERSYPGLPCLLRPICPNIKAKSDAYKSICRTVKLQRVKAGLSF